MSLLDKLKSFLPGSSSTGADAGVGHDHSEHGHSHSHEPAAPPVDPLGMPAADTTPQEGDSASTQRP